MNNRLPPDRRPYHPPVAADPVSSEELYRRLANAEARLADLIERLKLMNAEREALVEELLALHAAILREAEAN